MFTKRHTVLILLMLTVIGFTLHFYNLNWGAPFYFHPDERNIASAVSQLQLPHQMNPHFFAYGSLPIYAIYFTAVGANYLSQVLQLIPIAPIQIVSFDQAIMISRIFSALFATFLIPIMYFLGKKMKNTTTGIIAAFLTTASVGFIQFAHFGTFELWLTFFSVLLFSQCLSYLAKPSKTMFLLTTITWGILIAIKVSSLALLPLPFAVIAAQHFQKTHSKKISGYLKLSTFLSILNFLKKIVLFIVIAAVVYFATNPYVILDTKDFVSSMNYESSVALGTLSVFYTGNFADTTPGLYQFLHVYPFLLNPLITILFILSFIYLLFQSIKTKNQSFILLIAYFLFLFSSQAVLFVKWTRYMMPTLPFIYLTVAIASTQILQKKRAFAMTGVVIAVCAIFSFSYFKTAFINTDSRIDALLAAQRLIPVNATILSETADLGILPFQDAFPHLTTFNFYDLDTNSPDATEGQLQQKIAESQFIILPSQRILQPRITKPTMFPKGYVFYTSLVNGNLGFHKIYETPCDIFCKITYLGDPVYWWEQTVSVFDRPTVFIFKRNS